MLLSSLIIIITITQTEIVICEDSVDQEASNMSLITNSTNSEIYDASQVSEAPTLTQLRRKVDLKGASQPAVAIPASCHAKTFLETVYADFCAVRAGSEEVDDEDAENDREVTSVTRRIVCVEKTALNHHHTSTNAQQNVATVQIFNSSQLLSHLGSRANSSVFGRCTVVLFYAPWCTFCVRLAPHYNALARTFPTLDVVAIDAYHFSSLNSRFGTIAVPNIMVFHNAKAVARFNGTVRTLTHIAAFVTNVTGITPQSTAAVEEQDFTGPLSSELTHEPDYLLALSWLFVVACTVIAVLRSATGHRVWNTLTNHAHLHIN